MTMTRQARQLSSSPLKKMSTMEEIAEGGGSNPSPSSGAMRVSSPPNQTPGRLKPPRPPPPPPTATAGTSTNAPSYTMARKRNANSRRSPTLENVNVAPAMTTPPSNQDGGSTAMHNDATPLLANLQSSTRHVSYYTNARSDGLSSLPLMPTNSTGQRAPLPPLRRGLGGAGDASITGSLRSLRTDRTLGDDASVASSVHSVLVESGWFKNLRNSLMPSDTEIIDAPRRRAPYLPRHIRSPRNSSKHSFLRQQQQSPHYSSDPSGAKNDVLLQKKIGQKLLSDRQDGVQRRFSRPHRHKHPKEFGATVTQGYNMELDLVNGEEGDDNSTDNSESGTSSVSGLEGYLDQDEEKEYFERRNRYRRLFKHKQERHESLRNSVELKGHAYLLDTKRDDLMMSPRSANNESVTITDPITGKSQDAVLRKYTSSVSTVPVRIKRSLGRKIYLLLTEPQSSIFSAVFFIILIISITGSNIIMMMQTMNAWEYTPDECDFCNESNDIVFGDDNMLLRNYPLHPNDDSMGCECPPQPLPMIVKWEDWLIYFFSVEFTLRLCCYDPPESRIRKLIGCDYWREYVKDRMAAFLLLLYGLVQTHHNSLPSSNCCLYSYIRLCNYNLKSRQMAERSL
jgi:hypothetical protein